MTEDPPEPSAPVAGSTSASDLVTGGPTTPAPPTAAPSTGPPASSNGGPPADGGEEDGSEGEEPEPKRHSRRRVLIEWGVIIAVAVVVAVVVRALVFQTYFIPSTSMYPTLKPGDRIVVYKLDHSYSPGEIVVFKRPPAEDCGGPPVPDLVKRIIGLPNQVIQGKDGVVYINGKELAEPWLPHASSIYTSNFGPLRIPHGDYFMMGDNRVDSCDSRDWGPLPGSYIVGKVVMRIWPLNRVTFF